MKAIAYVFALVLSLNVAHSQNSKAKADDAGRIALTSVISDEISGMSASSRSFLKNKLNQVTSKYGIGSSSENERFIITANIQIVTKDITSTAPPMHAYTLEVSFFIGDGVDGKLFASTSTTLKGVGETETKAYKAALKNIKSSNPMFKPFIEEGKNKIIEYYNSQCDAILKGAEALAATNQFDAAIYKLVSIPEACTACYDKAMKALVPIYQKQVDRNCKKLLTDARSAWNEGMDSYSAQKASQYLGQIEPNSKCSADAQKLTSEIAKRIKEVDKREWGFKLKQQQDNVDSRKATINAAREVGVAHGKNQPKNTYNYKGWM